MAPIRVAATACTVTLLLASCGAVQGDRGDGGRDPAGTTAAGRLTVTARDGSLTVPRTTVPAGPLRVAFVNQGTFTHNLVVTDLSDAPPISELAKLSEEHILEQSPRVDASYPMPAGRETHLDLDLDPGAYGLFCLVEANAGGTHAFYGMWREIEVV